MNYEEFKKAVIENFSSFLPDRYQNVEVSTARGMKVNREIDSLVCRDLTSNVNAGPSIPIDDMFDKYENGESFDEIMSKVAEIVTGALDDMPKELTSDGLDFEGAKDKIVMCLVNTEQNREMLKHVPHREFEDLSIIYRWCIKNDHDGMRSTIVNDGLAERIGVNEEELYRLASENTKKILPITVRSMEDVISEMIMGDIMGGVPQKDEDEIAFEEMISDLSTQNPMYVISNKSNMFGASAILYEENLRMLAEKLDDNLFILPSSIHECIAVPASMGIAEELSAMVLEGNTEQVELADRLSNNVYHYDKDMRTLKLASDNPVKRLDGKVADTPADYNHDGQKR